MDMQGTIDNPEDKKRLGSPPQKTCGEKKFAINAT